MLLDASVAFKFCRGLEINWIEFRTAPVFTRPRCVKALREHEMNELLLLVLCQQFSVDAVGNDRPRDVEDERLHIGYRQHDSVSRYRMFVFPVRAHNQI